MLSKQDYRRRLVWVWVLGFAGLGVIFARVNCWRFFQLGRDGVLMQATVTALEPDSREAIKYSYEANGARFEGDGSPGYGNPALQAIRVGDRIRGYYLHDDPSVSCLGNPEPQLWWKLGIALFWAILIPSLIVFRASRRFDQWLRRQEEQRQLRAGAAGAPEEGRESRS